MKRGKNGQIKLSFGMIFSIILIIVFLAFAFYAIKTFLGIRDAAQTGKFINDLKSDIDRVWKSTESSEEREYVLPSKIDYICFVDFAGNSDTREISFTIETDTVPPVVVRIFRDGLNLKIITSEEATCVYDNKDCLYDFDDGIGMTTSDDKVHSTAWDSNKNFYIKCQDEFGNQPAPQSCSITVRPFEI